MKIVLCGMLYRDADVVLEMLRSALPYVDEAVFATAPLPYIKPLPDDGTNEMAQEYGDRLHKLVTFDDRIGLSHEQQNHVLDHLQDGDYAFWVAADEVATGDVRHAMEMVRIMKLDGYRIAYKEANTLKTLRASLQRGFDTLRTRQLGIALKMSIIRYRQGDHFANNHWSYYDKDGRLAVEGLYRTKGDRSEGAIGTGDLTMVDIAHKRNWVTRERRLERYAILRSKGWDERKLIGT